MPLQNWIPESASELLITALRRPVISKFSNIFRKQTVCLAIPNGLGSNYAAQVDLALTVNTSKMLSVFFDCTLASTTKSNPNQAPSCSEAPSCYYHDHLFFFFFSFLFFFLDISVSRLPQTSKGTSFMCMLSWLCGCLVNSEWKRSTHGSNQGYPLVIPYLHIQKLLEIYLRGCSLDNDPLKVR